MGFFAWCLNAARRRRFPCLSHLYDVLYLCCADPGELGDRIPEYVTSVRCALFALRQPSPDGGFVANLGHISAMCFVCIAPSAVVGQTLLAIGHIYSTCFQCIVPSALKAV
jgi:hypothetical protein